MKYCKESLGISIEIEIELDILAEIIVDKFLQCLRYRNAVALKTPFWDNYEKEWKEIEDWWEENLF